MAEDFGKEDFVKNLNGTTIFEVAGIVTHAPLCCLLYFILNAAFISRILEHGNGHIFLVENAFLVIPNLLVLTILECHVWLTNIIQGISCIVLWYIILYRKAKSSGYSSHHSNDSDNSKPCDERKQFVSNYRAFMNIATILSILAVDFKIYPRRFAKAEVYGTGFMDIGVGSFIFGHAIISPFARGTSIRSQHKYIEVLKKHFVGCIPIIILGMLRLISIKGTNYHEHVTEYGVHWNFFFTLAFVKFFAGTTIQFLQGIVRRRIWICGIAICLCYQLFLSYFGLKDFIQNGSVGDGSRSNLIDANREGLTSCIGYTGLFIIASFMGSLIFHARTKSDLLKELVTLDAILWSCTLICKLLIDNVSRQMANLTYVIWILSLNVYLLLCFLLVDMAQDLIIERLSANEIATMSVLTPRRALHSLNNKEPGESHEMPKVKTCREPLLVKAISRNQLFYFLLGNILTGMVNLSMHTEHASDFTAMAILTCYILVTNGIIVLLHVKNVSTKFW